MIPEDILASRDPADIRGWLDAADGTLDAATTAQVKALWEVAAQATAAETAPRSRVALVEGLDVFDLRRRAGTAGPGSAEAAAYLRAYGLGGTAPSREAEAFLAHYQILHALRHAVLGMAAPGAIRLFDDADVRIRSRAIVPFLREDVRLPPRGGLRNFGDLGLDQLPPGTHALAAALMEFGVLPDALVSHAGIGQVPLALANRAVDAAAFRETHQDLGEDCQVALVLTCVDPRGGDDAPPVAVLPVADEGTLRAFVEALSSMGIEPGSAGDLLAWLDVGNGRAQIDQAYAKATGGRDADELDLDFAETDDAIDASWLDTALDLMDHFLVLAVEASDPADRAAHRQHAVEQSVKARDAYEAAQRDAGARAERALGLLDGRRRPWSRW